jgi:hypothetical protein
MSKMVIPRFGLVEHFDDMRLDNATKLKIGWENTNQLFSLNLSPLPERAAAGFTA